MSVTINDIQGNKFTFDTGTNCVPTLFSDLFLFYQNRYFVLFISHKIQDDDIEAFDLNSRNYDDFLGCFNDKCSTRHSV